MCVWVHIFKHSAWYWTALLLLKKKRCECMNVYERDCARNKWFEILSMPNKISCKIFTWIVFLKKILMNSMCVDSVTTFNIWLCLLYSFYSMPFIHLFNHLFNRQCLWFIHCFALLLTHACARRAFFLSTNLMKHAINFSFQRKKKQHLMSQ